MKFTVVFVVAALAWWGLTSGSAMIYEGGWPHVAMVSWVMGTLMIGLGAEWLYKEWDRW